MCNSNLISKKIANLSSRSVAQQVEIMDPLCFNKNKLMRLNSDLDNFYELIYNQWTIITEKEYNIFGKQFSILLSSLKNLLCALKKIYGSNGLDSQMLRLDRNYSALKELNSDILYFRIKAPKDPELNDLMTQISFSLVNDSL